MLRALFISFGALALSLLGLALTAHDPVGLLIFLFLVGGSAAALSPTIQTRLMDVAGDSQTLAAAVNHSSLNLGNSLGALLGGVVIAAGWGYVAPTWIGLALLAARRGRVRASRRCAPSDLRQNEAPQKEPVGASWMRMPSWMARFRSATFVPTSIPATRYFSRMRLR